jgi:hypothetical protein
LGNGHRRISADDLAAVLPARGAVAVEKDDGAVRRDAGAETLLEVGEFAVRVVGAGPADRIEQFAGMVDSCHGVSLSKY